VARHTPVTREATGKRERPRRWRIVVLVGVALVVIVLMVLSLVGAPFREVRSIEGNVTPGVPRMEVGTVMPSRGE
jgi:hypothetical protein